MIKLGNIVYKGELVNHNTVEFINYYNEKKSLWEIDNSLPTLYVGWKFFKEANPETNFIQKQSILEKKVVSKALYWEFSFEENKSDHVTGVNFFVKDVPYYYFSSKYSYTNIDPVFFSISNIDELILLLPKDGFDKIYNYKNEMLYVLKNNLIYGIDLNMYGFFEFNIKEIIDTLTNQSSIYVYDEDGSYYQNYDKIFINFEMLKRYIVVLV